MEIDKNLAIPVPLSIFLSDSHWLPFEIHHYR